MKSIYRFEVQVEIDKPEPTQVVRVKIIEGIESKGLTVQYTKELEVKKWEDVLSVETTVYLIINVMSVVILWVWIHHLSR